MLLKSIIYSGWFTVILMMSACSSHIPPEIRQPLNDSPSVSQVHKQADSYLSQKIRWGGIILNTENKQNASWLTIIALPLNESGKPLDSDQSPGRFIAIVDEFLEPMVYSPDRQITVTGHLIRTETQQVGEFSYEYPVIQVEHYYLWPAKPEQTYVDYPPYWHNPWYYPYGYSWPYPYYPQHRHHH